MNHYLDTLKKQVDYTLKTSLFYQNKFQGFDLSLNFIEDFYKLPFTVKQELLDDQIECPPFGSNVCVGKEQIERIHKTSGTTNKPLLIVLTKNDIFHTVQVGAACFRLSGLRQEHIVVHCLNYNMWAGGYTDHQSLEEAGAAVIPFGVGHTKELIETILTIRPQVIHCTPSYLRKIESVLSESFQMLPQDLQLKLGLFGAEPGLQNKAFRAEIEKKWGLIAMNANYGMSDVLSMFGSECNCKDGLHFMGDNLLFPELINSSTLEKIEINEGAVGELVLTNLKKEAQPLIRYRTKDVIRILKTHCSCGNQGFKFEIVGRSDDMIVVRGVNVFLSTVENMIGKYLDVLTGEFQVHISENVPVERFKLVYEIKNECIYNEEVITQLLFQDFENALFFKPEMQQVKQGELPLNESKTKRLFKTL